LESKFSLAGGYSYQYQIEMMLFRFGFGKEDLNRKLSTFSGGERMKAAFVKLLLINPDLMILDEPTNHLDIETIEWLEDYLKTYQGSIFFVSHDRYFINALAEKIIELDQKHIEEFHGDYDYYAAEKKLRYEQRLELYKRQQAEAEKLKWFITFYMPKPRFASRAHDREKKLARLEDKMIDKPIETRNKLNMEMDGWARKGKRLVECKDLSIGFDNNPLISGINFVLFGGDKMAVMGQNGSGKTTFIRCLLHQIRPLSGSLNFLSELNIGYLKQESVSISSPYSIYDYIKSRFPKMTNQEIYNHLGKYGFSFEDDKKIVDTLSGGEKMRVIFAELVLHKYDLLILDEPTNNLDMMTKEELISALKEYQGTLIIVSHDRYFVDSVADRLLYFEDKKPYVYDGRYSDFKVEVLDQVEKEKEEKAFQDKKGTDEDKKDDSDYNHPHQAKTAPRLSEDKIEQKMTKLENEMAELKKNIDDPAYYNDPIKMNDLEKAMKGKEDEYSELMEMLSYYEDKQ
jgi:ATP-binding cassette subfamily F protein 3